ncbi:hypothetical protein [Aestuariibacter sp. A3R04]|uniref:hypothetical protein n=1 Tax=Aestuariibacter sp. A3R04 TaxID=2841571 RepID=UPI001C0A3550|nr:hypothetical protein [Aestuariibacter sp. A3R04]MBU3020414.1 hypothetical protein [Aestuariibacter sp. A3R04]
MLAMFVRQVVYRVLPAQVTTTDYQENYFHLGPLTLKPGDIIAVLSKAVTNGKIPEKGGTAYSRGRWRGLVLQQ